MSPARAANSAISSDADGSAPAGAGEFMLFGVRVVVDSMRKSVSMNNLSQYELPQDAANNNNNGNKEDALAAGYASADEAAAHNSHRHRERERKRGPIDVFDRLSVLAFFATVILRNFVCFVGLDFGASKIDRSVENYR